MFRTNADSVLARYGNEGGLSLEAQQALTRLRAATTYNDQVQAAFSTADGQLSSLTDALIGIAEGSLRVTDPQVGQLLKERLVTAGKEIATDIACDVTRDATQAAQRLRRRARGLNSASLTTKTGSSRGTPPA